MQLIRTETLNIAIFTKRSLRRNAKAPYVARRKMEVEEGGKVLL
jgi:hypothetical protein